MTLQVGTLVGTSKMLALPDDVVVQKLAILATSGAGKSNAAVVLAEQMFHAGLPWVAIDPKGDWWGIRSSRSGKSNGLSIPVLGGLHGDVPLTPSSGKTIARLVAERRLTCVLDVSEFDSLQDTWRFLHDFARELLRINRHPLHVFAEEAADYLPQSKSEKGWLPKCLNAWRRLISHGRNHGIGMTLISQRSAKLDKEALDLVETLVAMRATSPRDLAAISGWTSSHDVSAELVDSLPSLEDGEAWIWSPHQLKLATRVKFDRRATFDSGATPLLAAAASQTPAHLAPADLEALNAEMAETIERAKADDPEELRREIVKLRRELAERPSVEPEVVIEHIRVPYVPDELRVAVGEFMESVRLGILDHAEILKTKMEEISTEALTPEPAAAAPRSQSREARPAAPPPAPRAIAAPASTAVRGKGGAPHRLLVALATHGTLTKRRAGAYAGIAPTRSTLRNAISTLNTQGLITVSGEDLTITEAGENSLDGDFSLPTGAALLDLYRSELGIDGAPRRIFDYLVDCWPQPVTKEHIAEWLDLDPGTSTIRNALSRIRTLGLLEKREIVIPREIMEAVR